MRHTMHLRPGVAKQPNLELKTRPKQLLGSFPLVIALPGLGHFSWYTMYLHKVLTLDKFILLVLLSLAF